MKRFLLICLILITAGSLVAQTPTVASLTVTSGSAIKWYSAATGGTLYNVTEALVNGRHYFGSQTVNGVESSTRLDVTATVTAFPAAPAAGTNTPSQTQVVWNWNAATSATGYKWNTVNNYSTATDMLTATNKAETGLACGTSYTRYIWAYNTTVCGSSATTLTQTTSTCLTGIAGGASSVCDGSPSPPFTNATAGGTWSISNGGSYATINSNGIVTGVSPGTATVAYTLSGNTVTASITVVDCTTVRNDGVTASSLTASSATLLGMMYPGGPNATRRGFKYSTNQNFNPASEGIDAFETGNFSGNIEFYQTISGLSNGTTYYYYAYSITSSGAAFSTKKAFAFFGYTGAEQTFTVPTGANVVSLYTWGASGGRSLYGGTSRGGYGGYWQKDRTGADMPAAGTTLYVYVGGNGADGPSSIVWAGSYPANPGGWNGGGNGNGYGGGGGGATDIRMGGNTLSNRIQVGGGGGGTTYPGDNAPSPSTGGDVESANGGNGLFQGAYNSAFCGAGVLHTVFSGGAASLLGGNAGSFGTGGSSGIDALSGAGGGGGYYGGGASVYAGGGGAGSNYTSVAGGGLGTLGASQVSSVLIFISF